MRKNLNQIRTSLACICMLSLLTMSACCCSGSSTSTSSTSSSTTTESTSNGGWGNGNNNQQTADITESPATVATTEYIDPATVGPLKNEGDVAPDFTVQTTSGKDFKLSEHRGEVVVINFWATWCFYCVEEMPAIQSLYEEYPNVNFILINCMEDRGTVDQFLKEEGFSFPVGYDFDGSVSNQYPTEGIPYTVIVDQDGIAQTIIEGSYGDQQYDMLKKSIEALNP